MMTKDFKKRPSIKSLLKHPRLKSLLKQRREGAAKSFTVSILLLNVSIHNSGLIHIVYMYNRMYQ